METVRIAREIASLPVEAQKQIRDFVAFLKTRYPDLRNTQKTQPGRLIDEPFVGMWSERKDLEDSTAWVRELRRREWKSIEWTNAP